ncbi:YcaO-like family protein [Alkaliphilus serpentinus]|uniref:YcaO domain-containing protein n=1 Tax=Alkaliphilus serpentinus TaxID=1482731 RepID=A0A833M5T3_9FIRM|nr:YcaO-like family protein [Alkaliphilus serpentinus]KAB3524860.1 hypothetical protein F8153_15685 [Alkaliphilus serpentinus]
MNFHSKKYKDELPLNTITRIRNILADLGILVIETGWQNSVEDFYSVNLKIANTSIATNGKGTTYQYALASGYGEMLERLQNQSFFRLNADFSHDAYQHKGFYYTPDEKEVSIDELLNSKEEWITKQFKNMKKNIDKKQLLNKWKKVSYEETPSEFIALPYINILSNKISHIPIKMVTKMYMSNGMCGGNTYEEALVQGLSEVFERHVNKEIIKMKITPPTIPQTFLKEYPRIENMITQIERSGNFQVIVKDCSLNEGYPVIGVVFINKDDQSYFVKFGSHPMIEISIERTLTELLQGQDIRKMMGVKEYSYKSKIEDEYNNIMGILVNGSGYYPKELFSTKFSYEFTGYEDLQVTSNKHLLNYYTNLLRDKGLDCFARDVSFLGFPSFHVIVPGLSEIDEFDDIKAMDDYGEYNEVKRVIRNIHNSSEEEINKVIGFFNKNSYNSGASIVQFLNLPTSNFLPWYYIGVDLFIAALLYRSKKYKEAANALGRFVDFIGINASNNIQKTFFSCARDYISGKGDNLNDETLIELLSQFYPLPVVQGIISDFGDPENIMKYGELKCFNCDECMLSSQCMYKENEKVYLTIKEQYFDNPSNQEDLLKRLR